MNSVALRSGASAAQLAQVEAALDVCFPDDVKAAYQIHDGMDLGAEPRFSKWRILPLDAVLSIWLEQQRLSASGCLDNQGCAGNPCIQPVWWHAQWVPLCANSKGDLICLDLHPGPGGAVGQLISYWHLRADRNVLAESFTEWLRTGAAASKVN